MWDQKEARVGLSSNKGGLNVRFGSKADICAAKWHVRFTPESGHVRCISAYVRFGSKVIASPLRLEAFLRFGVSNSSWK